MVHPGDDFVRPSPFKFWALTPVVLFALAVLNLPWEIRDATHLWTLIGFDAWMLLVLAVWCPYHRVPYLDRMLTGLVALPFGVLFGVAGVRLLSEVFTDRSSATHGKALVVALVGFSVIGWPALKYTLLGRFTLSVPPLAFDPDDELMIQAHAQARASLPRFFELLPRAARAAVQFRFESRPPDCAEEEPVIEYLWGEAVQPGPDSVRVRLLNQPFFHETALPDTLDVPLADLRDWEIEEQDGRLQGGFSMHAAVAMAKRDRRPVPGHLRCRLRQYRRPTAEG